MTNKWDLIQEARVQVELNNDAELDEALCKEDTVAKEASAFLEAQLFTMHMEEAEPEEPVFELRKDVPEEDDPTVCSIKRANRAYAHGTASTIVDFPFEGWDLDSLVGENGRDLAYMLEIISNG